MAKTPTTSSAEDLAALKARILDGAQDVTAEELARATALAELDELQREADRQAAARQAEAERLAAVRQVRDRLLDFENALDHQADVTLIAEATARVLKRDGERVRLIDDSRTALTRLGVPVDAQPVENVSHGDAGMGYGDHVTIDGQRLQASREAGAIIADALGQACNMAGLSHGVLVPNVRIHAKRKPRQETDEQRALVEKLRAQAIESMQAEAERKRSSNS